MKTQKSFVPAHRARRNTRQPNGPLQSAADARTGAGPLAALQRMADAQGPAQRMQDEEMQGKFIQRAEAPNANRTGLPDNLKSGIENLSGMSMDHVRVHRNSDKPATVQAHAYAQGSDIHLGPGQEKHLPHEAWHVVQQAQGRVTATTQLKGVALNDDAGLEHEADVMGAKAVQMVAVAARSGSQPVSGSGHNAAVAQLVLIENTAENRQREAQLTAQYHNAEDNARATLLENGGNWTADILQRAINFWQNAADLRTQAGAMHVEQDAGHLQAIRFCENRVNMLSGLLARRR
ncbi:protein of unknown function [Yoonia tamlensis]|uniref:eCIS core domain-containing protein n=1 Tax=Yoonia tamlensis TaxID=390270 RepID=A0A1I6FU17_9RHOB|nr:DUF4157 domain-containing protein [Yoonia tamlensis]SFR33396.1 protein of unknown function [Yoonia tamlensis]